MRPSQRRDDLRQLVPARLAALTAQSYTWLQRQQTLETTSANCANPASQEGAARQCESGPQQWVWPRSDNNYLHGANIGDNLGIIA